MPLPFAQLFIGFGIRPWNKKVFQASGVTTSALDDLGTSTPLDANTSPDTHAAC